MLKSRLETAISECVEPYFKIIKIPKEIQREKSFAFKVLKVVIRSIMRVRDDVWGLDMLPNCLSARDKHSNNSAASLR